MKSKSGYKQTDIGLIPINWEPTVLARAVVKVGSGITPEGGSRVYHTTGRPFLRSQNVGWGVLLLDDIAFIDDDTHRSFASTEVRINDVLLNITGASIGRSALADDRIQGGNVNQHVCIIRTKSEILDPKFLNLFLLSPAGQRQIDSFQAGGNRQGLNFAQIKHFRFPLPPLNEQHAISTLLNKWDTAISLTRSLIAQKQQRKRALMQQLLTGKRRLPGFEGEWKNIRLSDLGIFSKGNGITKDELVPQGIPCIRYGEIYTRHNDWIRKFYSFISPETAATSQRLCKGDLLFAGSGETAEEIGKCVAFLGAEEAYAGGDIVILRPQCELDSRFFGYLLNASYVAEQKATYAQGNAIVHISAMNLGRVNILVPSLQEQIAIANILNLSDHELKLLNDKLDAFKDQKKGMMQKLLTGEWRVGMESE